MRPRCGPLGLAVIALVCGLDFSCGSELAISSAPQMDGYAVDTDRDGAGDAKVLGCKFQALAVGGMENGIEARAWIPFALTPEQKREILKPDASVTLRLFLADKRVPGGGVAEICGAGARKDFRVNQNDFATLCKRVVPNAFGPESLTGSCHEFDVTDFVREEAARANPDAPGFGFLVRLRGGDAGGRACGDAFFIGSTGRSGEGERPVLVVSKKPRTKNLPDQIGRAHV